MPVPSDKIKSGLVEAAFRVEAENLKLPKLEVKDFETADDVPGDYFRVWIWAEEEDGDDGATIGEGDRIIGKCLLMRFDESVRFDLQYGRKVMRSSWAWKTAWSGRASSSRRRRRLPTLQHSGRRSASGTSPSRRLTSGSLLDRRACRTPLDGFGADILQKPRTGAVDCILWP